MDAFLRPIDGPPPPYVELVGERLYYLPDPAHSKDSICPKGMLNAFVRIRDGEDIVRFARRYGVLQICAHGQPVAHRRACDPLADERGRWDPVPRWLAYVAQAKAILDIAGKLHREIPVKPADWKGLDELFSWVYPDGVSREIQENPDRNTRSFHQTLVILTLLTWVELADVKPLLWWFGEKPSIRLYYAYRGWTFGVLTVQLMMAVGTARDVALCDGCGLPYLRLNRAPQRGRRNYCLECRGTVAARLRKRAQRA